MWAVRKAKIARKNLTFFGTSLIVLGCAMKAYAGPNITADCNSTVPNGTDATQCGENADASGDETTAVGESAVALGLRGVAVGFQADAGGDFTTVIAVSYTHLTLPTICSV